MDPSACNIGLLSYRISARIPINPLPLASGRSYDESCYLAEACAVVVSPFYSSLSFP